jgi:chloramphenicol 3-O phosphotransferase
MKKESVQIIYLNGPSSSGKTTLAKALQHAFEEPFLHIGIDKIIGWMPEKINDWTGGEASLGYSWKKSVDASGSPIQELQAGPYAQKIGKTFQEVVLALAKMGHCIVIDDVSFGKQQLDEWKKTLESFQVLWVGVNAPLPVLEQREKERGNRILGSARGQFHKVHVDVSYDLEIDTHQASISENVEKIKSFALCPSHLIEAPTKNLIRPMHAHDIAKIVSRYSFPWSTPEKTKILWDTYYQEQKDNIRTVAVIETKGEILGYGSLLRKPECPFFAQRNIPEINAIWIDEDHRRKGLGTALIKWLENLASHEGYNEIGIGVGLYRDYGPAQQLYFQLGYIPEGNGITYKDQPTVAGQTYPLDDDLLLWLSKALDRSSKESSK